MKPTSTTLDFNAILRDTQVQIRAYIAGMGVAPHEVDDLAQEVYLQLYLQPERLPADVAPVRWLKGIARNLCLNHFRKTSRRGRLHREALAELLSRCDQSKTSSDNGAVLRDALDGCIQKLPNKSRRLLELKYKQELTCDAVAETMESTGQAIRVALFRARAALRDCINRSLAREV